MSFKNSPCKELEGQTWANWLGLIIIGFHSMAFAVIYGYFSGYWCYCTFRQYLWQMFSMFGSQGSGKLLFPMCQMAQKICKDHHYWFYDTNPITDVLGGNTLKTGLDIKHCHVCPSDKKICHLLVRIQILLVRR